MRSTSLRETCGCGGLKHRRSPDGRFVPCECLRETLRIEGYERAGIPREFWHVGMEQFPQATWFEEVKRHASDLRAALTAGGEFPVGILLHGRNEMGALLAASLILRLFVHGERTALFLRMERCLQMTFRRNREAEDGVDPVEPEALCLHLGAEIRNRAAVAVLENLYWERRSRGRYTCATFLGDLGSARERYGDDGARILTDPERFVPVRVD